VLHLLWEGIDHGRKKKLGYLVEITLQVAAAEPEHRNTGIPHTEHDCQDSVVPNDVTKFNLVESWVGTPRQRVERENIEIYLLKPEGQQSKLGIQILSSYNIECMAMWSYSSDLLLFFKKGLEEATTIT
jgi:hypothetical protein